jgi:hypothetical protein
VSPRPHRAAGVARARSDALEELGLRERIADGITLRQFTDFYCENVRKHDGFNRLTPAMLKAINDLVVGAAVQLGVEDGSKLRVDTTVVETDIHHPTDNTLLWGVVRVLTRLPRPARRGAGTAAHCGFSQSLACCASAHVRDSTQDNAATSGRRITTDRGLPGADRPRR